MTPIFHSNERTASLPGAGSCQSLRPKARESLDRKMPVLAKKNAHRQQTDTQTHRERAKKDNFAVMEVSNDNSSSESSPIVSGADTDK